MSTVPLTRTVRPSLSWNRPLMLLACAMVVATAGCAIGLAVDDRILTGAPIWLKPFKFAVSIALYSVAWAWMISLLPKRSKLVTRTAAGLTAVLVLEYVILVTQVVRGKQSHFNVATPVDSAMFSLMGVSIAGLWAGTAILSVVVLRKRFGSRSETMAVRIGAVVSLAGMGLGALMLGPTAAQRQSMKDDTFQGIVGAHSVGVTDGGPAMPVTGWSSTGGDLRIPHFVGMHALQLFPLLAIALVLLASRLPLLRDDDARTRLVIVAGGGYAGLVALVTWQALRGQSLIHPDALTLAALGVLVVGVAVGTVVALRPAVQPLDRELVPA